MTKANDPKTRYSLLVLIIASFVLALILSILPLPASAKWFRPLWLAMMLMYWQISLPERVGFGTGWILGLLLDIILGSGLGVHALAMTVLSYLTQRFNRQISCYPVVQRTLIVFAILWVYQFLIYFIQSLLGHQLAVGLFSLPVISSILLWHWSVNILTDIQRRLVRA